jgi:hypothetical protein
MATGNPEFVLFRFFVREVREGAVQLPNRGNMDRRSLFYWSLAFSWGLEAGQGFPCIGDKLSPVRVKGAPED